jgi:protein-S-isoprenylcysteine O-methyltransferase Ste14
MAFLAAAALLALHALVVAGMLLHPARLGRERGDASHDAPYTPLRAFLAYAPIFAAQGFGLWASRPDGPSGASVAAGAAIFFLGLGVRLWAIATLGRLFTMEIGVREGHRIVEDGPYRWVRHPSYAGYLAMLLGIGVALRSWVALAIPLAETAVFQALRIRREEAMLLAHFGDAYRAYMARTKRLVPFVF